MINYRASNRTVYSSKFSINRKSVLFLMWLSLFVATKVKSDCENLYFAPVDYISEVPLTKPHHEFAAMLNKARRGDAASQRGVGISYETGYLVSACKSKATYWYQKAASNGDLYARMIVERANAFTSVLSEYPENIITGRWHGPGQLICANWLCSQLISPSASAGATNSAPGDVTLGMSMDQVRAAWGEPKDIARMDRETADGSRSTVIWTYQKDAYTVPSSLVFRNGIVSEVNRGSNTKQSNASVNGIPLSSHSSEIRFAPNPNR